MALQMEWALSPPSHWEVVLSLLPRLFLHCDEQHRLLLLLRPNPVINIDGRRYRGVIWFLLSFRTALGVSVRLLSQLLLLCYYRVDFSAPFGGAALDEQRNWIEWTDKTEHQMPLFFWSDVTWWMSHMMAMFLVRGQRRFERWTL